MKANEKTKKTIVVQINQPHKKEKRSRKLLWTIPIWATAFIVVFNLIFVIIMIVSGNDNKIGEIIEIDGLSMVGIAISVWIGINVYNLISRKELQKLDRKISDLEHMLKESRENAKKALVTAPKKLIELFFPYLMQRFDFC